MSPLKRFNKVAPTSGKPNPLKFTEEESAPLKSSSASLLEQNVEEIAKTGKRERPDSAPLKREDTQRQQIPIDVNVIVQSNESGAAGIIEI